MKFIIVTGMSGAGKTIALKMLEDMDYYCVDNLPVLLLERFADLAAESEEHMLNRAVGIDIRNQTELPFLETVLANWDKNGFAYEILFLDASEEVLIKRFKETRRAHPLTKGMRIHTGIQLERQQLAFLREKADYIIDTSRLLTRELKQKMEEIYLQQKAYNNLYITIISFGFKYGLPIDGDLIFDVRFLPNPFYVSELRAQTGNEKAVQDYVTASGTADVFLNKLTDMVEFLIPHYTLEGKNQLVICIGCTGGKHRSVTMANKLYESLKSEECGLKLIHRDIENDGKKERQG